MSKRKNAGAKRPRRSEVVGSTARAVVRFLALLPDDFSTVADPPDDMELSQISFGLHAWAESVIGHEECERAQGVSLLAEDEEQEGVDE